MYESDSDPYVYPGTHVLKNLLGITSGRRLATLERRLTAARADQGLPTGKFDYAHYKSIHHHLFQDVYEWAGKPRTVNLAKGGSPFCRVEFIDGQMNKLFADMRAEKFLAGHDFAHVARRAAYFIIELNAVHPFREGNGRTQHAFLGLLLARAGHPRDLSRANPHTLLQAAN